MVIIMKYNKIILLVFVFLIFNGCYKTELVRGPDYNIYIFCEYSDWDQLNPVLSEVFNRTIRTPQKEFHFNLVHVNPDSFQYSLPQKQLIFLASLESEGSIADIVKRAVNDPEREEKVKSGESFLFKNTDQWGREQLNLIMASTTILNLGKLIRENSDLIYETMLEHQQKVVDRFMYRRSENKDASDGLLEKYLWKVKVQHDYSLAIEDSAGQFVFLRRRIPERWMFVKWFENSDRYKITKEWYLDMRDSIGVKYYGGDTVNRKYTSSKEINFLGKWCLKIEGLWENVEKVAGGPFVAYAFYDDNSRRIYMMDCSVFAPDMEKVPLLDQLNAMARTFKTKIEVVRDETGG